MRAVYTEYKNLLNYFLGQKIHMVLLLLTCLLSYGFTIANYSIGVDDTALARYLLQGEFLAQGRFGGYLVGNLLGITTFTPFWTDFLAVILLLTSSLIWSVLIKRIMHDKFPNTCYIIFSAILVSYPLINEIFIYMGGNISVCLGYGLTAISLIFAFEYIINRESKLFAVFSTIVIAFYISLYESFAAVYISGMFIILILKYLVLEPKNNQVKEFCIYILKFLFLLLLGIILKETISHLIITILGLPKSNVAQTTIYWIKNDSFSIVVNNFIWEVKRYIFWASLVYMPISIFLLANLLAAMMCAFLVKRYKSILILLLFLGVVLSNFALITLQGIVLYRACQVFAIFVSFIFTLSYYLVQPRKVLKVLMLLLICILILNQTRDLNQWFYHDYLRYQEEKSIATRVAATIQSEFDNTKPVVFVGAPQLSKAVTHYGQLNDSNTMYTPLWWIVKSVFRNNPKVLTLRKSELGFNQTNGYSVVGWGVRAFHENSTELLNFMRMLGYSFTQASDQQVESGVEDAKSMPVWPKKGSIREFSNYIVVKFGDDG